MFYPVTPELLQDIECHINNYFNSNNDPRSSERNYPAAFLKLAGNIQQYADNPPNFNGSDPNRPLYTSWQSAFARDLSVYKRVKFI